MYALRGKQGIQGPQGEQGEQGDPGVNGDALFTITIVADPAIVSKTLTLFASAAKSGTMHFFGQVSFDASALNTTTITPIVNGVNLTAFVAKTTTPLGQYDSITFSGTAAITAGQAFAISYLVTGGGSINVNTGAVTYTIQ